MIGLKKQQHHFFQLFDNWAKTRYNFLLFQWCHDQLQTHCISINLGIWSEGFKCDLVDLKDPYLALVPSAWKMCPWTVWPSPRPLLVCTCLPWLTFLWSAKVPIETKCNVTAWDPKGSSSSCLSLIFKILHFFVFCKFTWRTAAFCRTNSETSDLSTSQTSLGLTVSPKVSSTLLSCELFE